MDQIFSEIARHQSLGQVIERIGQLRFWRQLMLLLNELVPFDNALALHCVARNIPLVLEEFDADDAPQPSPVPLYLSGLYLLDPFWQACQNEISDGLYRLSDVAPDLFRQSEYFQKYSRDAIGDDEVQVILKLAPQEHLLLSLGANERFDPDKFGRLAACVPWLLALMRQHWSRSTKLKESTPPAPNRLEQALASFGAQKLSARETEIAQMTLRGNSSKAIANALSISVETVKVHRRHLYQKLGVTSQPELFSLFLQALEGDLQLRA
jgi:DNA-binding CsgD family transcriptional regulator